MVKRTVTEVYDDLDGSRLADQSSSVQFGFEGRDYEIDLSEHHVAELRAVFAPYVTCATPTRSPTETLARPESRAVRAWAESQGFHIKPQGRISNDLLQRYQAAQAEGR